MVDQTSSGTGAGQQVPGDGSSDYTVIRFLFRQMAAFLDTMKIVRVEAVTGGGADQPPPRVDVTILVNMIDGAANATPHGVVYGLPVVRIGGGTGAIVADPKPGDVGIAIVADRDSSLVTGAEQVNPGSWRHHDVADGVYLGQMFGAAPTQRLAFTDDGPVLADEAGNVVKLTSSGITLTPASGMPVKVEGPLVVTGNLQLGGTVTAEGGGSYAGNLTTSGTITGGTVKAGTVDLGTHRHTSASAGSPTSTPIP